MLCSADTCLLHRLPSAGRTDRVWFQHALYNPQFHHHLSTISLDRFHWIGSHLSIITPSIHLPGLSLFCISSHWQQNQTLVLVTTQQESCSFSQIPGSELPFPKHTLSPQLPTDPPSVKNPCSLLLASSPSLHSPAPLGCPGPPTPPGAQG